MDLICRLCCSTKFVHNNIFDEDNAILVKMSCLPIKIIKGDRFPQRICDKCICKLNDFYQYCNDVIEVQNNFKALLNNSDKNCDRITELTVGKINGNSLIPQCERSTQTEQKNTNIMSNDEVKIEAALQSSFTIKKENLVGCSDEPIPNFNSCDSEEEVLSKISRKNIEIRKKKKNIDQRKSERINTNLEVLPIGLITENDVNVIKSGRQMELNIVKHKSVEITPKEQNTIIPIINNNQKTYFCCICFLQSDTQKNMLKHYKAHITNFEMESQVPPIPGDRRCHRCQKTVQASSWASHWRRHWPSPRRPYRCDLCDKTFRNHYAIFRHGQTQIHKKGDSSASSKRFSCDTCPEGFAYRKCLLAHRIEAHPESSGRALQLRCGVCAREFAHLASLRRHQRSHTGERNYLCNMCGKALSSRDHLISHIRIHAGNKPHVCGTCGKGFVQQSNLKLHERVHSGEKPHVCSHCGKAFSQRSTLVIHERYHSGARPYSCELCGRGFVAKGLLSMHLKTACLDHPPTADKKRTAAVDRHPREKKKKPTED